MVLGYDSKNYPVHVGLIKVVRSGDLVSYCAEEGVRLLGQGSFLVSDSFPGNERTKYCLASKVLLTLFFSIKLVKVKLVITLEDINFWIYLQYV